ncbi:MAG: alanine dehydrogenase [Alphaproteobacteria bacterium]|jgi:alanine dehydrogenase|uniref:alanine dehydrogenase n=1 Tax=Pacificispira sp. TaxID=2888761 RepID=UPI001B081EB7|nr:alanine dehydrogenase [Alphaproteobacteria bacterium]MBO6863027.1 alanine dehydrogenase [Alphaproteobacteria bacterium]MEC9265952.1 alanine dehydrogenase [Pseudomonadota bacterium]
MLIGVPKEIKNHEYRVGLVPFAVRELVHNGHKVVIETQAGSGIGVSDDDYRAAGAEILGDAKTVFEKAEMIVKVKEPQAVECEMLREGQLLFTYLHLAPDLPQTEGLLKSGCVAIAYETVTSPRGGLPLLAPMSEVAGRMGPQAGAHCLEKAQGGRGVLMGGVPGVAPAKVVVLGGGVSGTNAARIALGMGAEVTVLERNIARIAQLDDMFRGTGMKTLYSTVDAVEKSVQDADLVIGAVLVPGAAAPKLINREMLKSMPDGSVVVDIAIDQGGCLETSRPTTHADPTFVEEGVVHYCVANMPGAVARTSTFALNNATLPFAVALANKGYRGALAEDPHLRQGLNVAEGKITYKAVSEAHGLGYTAPEEALGISF